jgi:hypothetical protein
MMEKVLFLECSSLEPLACHVSKQDFLSILAIEPTFNTLKENRKTFLPIILNQSLLQTLTAP